MTPEEATAKIAEQSRQIVRLEARIGELAEDLEAAWDELRDNTDAIIRRDEAYRARDQALTDLSAALKTVDDARGEARELRGRLDAARKEVATVRGWKGDRETELVRANDRAVNAEAGIREVRSKIITACTRAEELHGMLLDLVDQEAPDAP